MNTNYEKGLEAIYEGDLALAEEQLSKAIKADPQNAEAYFFRGKVHWQNANHTAAMSDFHKTLSINPRHNQAKILLEMANEIMGFRNPDLYNP